MAQRGANTGRDSQHRADTRYDRNLHSAPGFGPPLEGLADGRGHSKYTRIAARDHRNALSLRGSHQRLFGALQPLAIVRCSTKLFRLFGNPVEIGTIAE